MIFAARNEKNQSTCDLVLSGDKTVTRRLDGGRVYMVGKTYAVQRGRGLRSEGFIVIVSRMYHYEWVHKILESLPIEEVNGVLAHEAACEGFCSWGGLLNYFIKNNIDINNLIRYGFELKKE